MKQKTLKLMVVFPILFSMLFFTSLTKSQTLVEEQEQGLSLLKKVLSPRQINVLFDFTKSHREDYRKMLEKSIEYNELASQALDKIDLSENQEEALIEILSARIDKILPLCEPLLQSEKAIKQAILADEIDEQNIRNLSVELGKHIAEVALVLAEMANEAKDILNSDQLELIEEFRALAEEDEREAVLKMPERADEIIALYKALDIRPEQIDTLITLAKPFKKIYEERAKLEEKKMWFKLERILTEEQIKMLKAYSIPREEEIEKREKNYEEIALKLYYDLGITKPQIDKIADILINQKAEVIRLVDAIIESSWRLRDEVLSGAQSPEKIREASDDLGIVIGDALVLAWSLINEAKGTLTERQLELILDTIEYAEGEFFEILKIVPDEIKTVLALYEELDLTKEQKEALKKLVKDEIKRQNAELKLAIAVPGPLF